MLCPDLPQEFVTTVYDGGARRAWSASKTGVTSPSARWRSNTATSKVSIPISWRASLTVRPCPQPRLRHSHHVRLRRGDKGFILDNQDSDAAEHDGAPCGGSRVNHKGDTRLHVSASPEPFPM